MTEPRTQPRNRIALAAILLLAAVLRVWGIGFGLPALNDPDEPLFVMTALEMLRNHSLNPGWFGHPGTITLYGLALVALAVAGGGIATGQFADADAFVRAVYADPAILFLPARLTIAACGVLCVWLTWRLGRRIGGDRVGLLAAGFLAVNAVHIHYSQLIRTDIQASVFMLLALLCALAIAREGRWRDYLLAGLFVGLGCATKWPAAVIALSPVAAGLWRGEWRRVAGFGIASAASLFLASPYLLLDYPTVIANLGGEARPFHPGATGGGLLDNLGWYALHPLLGSLGVAGLVLAAIGTVWLALRNREAAVAVLPGVCAFALVLALQALRWERWIVPLLPFLAIAIAYALCALADLLRRRTGRRLPWLEAGAALLLAVPMLQATYARAVERANDTRQLATAWIRANAPPGASLLVEHAALDLLRDGRRLRFPLGSAGCVDAGDVLGARIRYSRVEKLRSGSPIVDLGHVEAQRLAGCRADYAILTSYDRYRAEPARYGAELARYRTLLQGGRLRAVIRPAPGARGGPVVHIVQLVR